MSSSPLGLLLLLACSQVNSEAHHGSRHSRMSHEAHATAGSDTYSNYDYNQDDTKSTFPSERSFGPSEGSVWPNSDSHWADVPHNLGRSNMWHEWGQGADAIKSVPNIVLRGDESPPINNGGIPAKRHVPSSFHSHANNFQSVADDKEVFGTPHHQSLRTYSSVYEEQPEKYEDYQAEYNEPGTQRGFGSGINFPQTGAFLDKFEEFDKDLGAETYEGRGHEGHEQYSYDNFDETDETLLPEEFNQNFPQSVQFEPSEASSNFEARHRDNHKYELEPEPKHHFHHQNGNISPEHHQSHHSYQLYSTSDSSSEYEEEGVEEYLPPSSHHVHSANSHVVNSRPSNNDKYKYTRVNYREPINGGYGGNPEEKNSYDDQYGLIQVYDEEATSNAQHRTYSGLPSVSGQNVQANNGSPNPNTSKRRQFNLDEATAREDRYYAPKRYDDQDKMQRDGSQRVKRRVKPQQHNFYRYGRLM